MTLEALLQANFIKLGAIRSEVHQKGVATHWLTEKEADIARDKLKEMGLWNVEKFPDGGAWAVFGKFPLEDGLFSRPKFPALN